MLTFPLGRVAGGGPSDLWETLLPGDIGDTSLEFGWFLDEISESMKWNKKHSGAQPCCALELKLGWLLCLHCHDPLETVSSVLS